MATIDTLVVESQFDPTGYKAGLAEVVRAQEAFEARVAGNPVEIAVEAKTTGLDGARRDLDRLKDEHVEVGIDLSLDKLDAQVEAVARREAVEIPASLGTPDTTAAEQKLASIQPVEVPSAVGAPDTTAIENVRPAPILLPTEVGQVNLVPVERQIETSRPVTIPTVAGTPDTKDAQAALADSPPVTLATALDAPPAVATAPVQAAADASGPVHVGTVVDPPPPVANAPVQAAVDAGGPVHVSTQIDPPAPGAGRGLVDLTVAARLLTDAMVDVGKAVAAATGAIARFDLRETIREVEAARAAMQDGSREALALDAALTRLREHQAQQPPIQVPQPTPTPAPAPGAPGAPPTPPTPRVPPVEPPDPRKFDLAAAGGARLVNQLNNLAAAAIGVSGPLGNIIGNLSVFAAGSTAAAAGAVGLTVLAGIYKFVTTAQREAREEQEKYTNALKEQTAQVGPAVAAQEALAAANKQVAESQRGIGERAVGAAQTVGRFIRPVFDPGGAGVEIAREVERRIEKEREQALRNRSQAIQNVTRAQIQAEGQVAEIITTQLRQGQVSTTTRRQALALAEEIARQEQNSLLTAQERNQLEAIRLSLIKATGDEELRQLRERQAAQQREGQLQVTQGALRAEEQALQASYQQRLVSTRQFFDARRDLAEAGSQAERAKLREDIAAEARRRPAAGEDPRQFAAAQETTIQGLRTQLVLSAQRLGLTRQQIDAEEELARVTHESRLRDIAAQGLRQERTSALAFTQADLQGQEAALRSSYQQMLVDTNTFFDRRRQLAQAAASADVADLRNQIDEARKAQAPAGATDTQAQEFAANQARIIAGLEQEIVLRNQRLGLTQAQITAEEALGQLLARQRLTTIGAQGLQQQRESDRALALQALQGEEQALETSYQRRLISTRRYFDRRLEIARQSTLVEIAALQQQQTAELRRERPAGTTEQDFQAQQAVVIQRLQQQIKLLQQRLGLTEDQINAERDLAAALAPTNEIRKTLSAVREVGEAFGGWSEAIDRAIGRADALVGSVQNIITSGVTASTALGAIGAGLSLLQGIRGLFGGGPNPQEIEHNRVLEENNRLLVENNAHLRAAQEGAAGVLRQQETINAVLARRDILERSERVGGLATQPGPRGVLGGVPAQELNDILEQAGTNIRDFAADIKATTGIDILDAKGRIVAEAWDQARIAIEKEIAARTTLTDDLDTFRKTLDIDAALAPRDFTGTAEEQARREQQANLERVRAVQLEGLKLSAAEEERVRSIDLSTQAGRDAFREWERVLHERIKNEQIGADELNKFQNAEDLRDSINEAAQGLNQMDEAARRAAESLTDFNLPSGFRRAALAFGAQAPPVPLVPIPGGPLTAASVAPGAITVEVTPPSGLPPEEEQARIRRVADLLDTVGEATTPVTDGLVQLATALAEAAEVQTTSTDQLRQLALAFAPPEGPPQAPAPSTTPTTARAPTPVTVTFGAGSIVINQLPGESSEALVQRLLQRMREMSMSQTGDTLQIGIF